MVFLGGRRQRTTLLLSGVCLFGLTLLILSVTPRVTDFNDGSSVAVALEAPFFLAAGVADRLKLAESSVRNAQPVLLQLTQRLTRHQAVPVTSQEYKSVLTILPNLRLRSLDNQPVLLADLRASAVRPDETSSQRVPRILHYFLETQQLTKPQCASIQRTIHLLRPERILFWQRQNQQQLLTGPGWDCLVANATKHGWHHEIVMATSGLPNSLFNLRLRNPEVQRDLARTQILLLIGGVLLSPRAVARRQPDVLLRSDFTVGRKRTFDGAVATHEVMLSAPMSTYLLLWQQLLYHSLQSASAWHYEFARVTDLLIAAFPEFAAVDTMPNIFELTN